MFHRKIQSELAESKNEMFHQLIILTQGSVYQAPHYHYKYKVQMYLIIDQRLNFLMKIKPGILEKSNGFYQFLI